MVCGQIYLASRVQSLGLPNCGMRATRHCEGLKVTWLSALQRAWNVAVLGVNEAVSVTGISDFNSCFQTSCTETHILISLCAHVHCGLKLKLESYEIIPLLKVLKTVIFYSSQLSWIKSDESVQESFLG